LRPASCPTSSTRAKENLPEDGETLELVEDVVDGVMRDVGAGDRASRPGRIGDAHLCGARDRVQPCRDPRHDSGLSEYLQVEHALDEASVLADGRRLGSRRCVDGLAIRA